MTITTHEILSAEAVAEVSGRVEAGTDLDQPIATREGYEEVAAAVAAAAESYYTTEQLIMDDAHYDALARAMAATEEIHPEWTVLNTPTTTVAAGTGGGDVPHTIPMLSLDNAFDEEGLRAWGERLDKVLGRPADGYTVEPKMDGLAIAARYVEGKLSMLVTRGNGQEGEDVTHAARLIQGLPATLSQPVTLEVRGEVYMSEKDFETANELRLANGEAAFANERNAAAGTLRAQHRTYDIPLRFAGYGAVHLEGGTEFDGARIDRMRHTAAMKIVEELGVTTTAMTSAGMAVCATVEEILAIIVALGEKRATLGFAVDGAVVKADSQDDRDKAGFSSRAPRWGIAWKYPAAEAITTLEDIVWQIGRTGLITPRAVVAPVSVGGVVVSAAGLHNPDDMVRRLSAAAGPNGVVRRHAKISVRRAGEVIPEIVCAIAPLEGEELGNEFEIPKVCPGCGAGIDKSQLRWRCAKKRNCPAALRQNLEYALSKAAWDADGWGVKVIEQLVDKGLVKDLADVFDLTREQLLTLDRMGEKSADNLLAQLEVAKTRPLSKFLTGLGVLLTGRSMSRRLAASLGTLEAVRAADEARFLEVEGVGPERASTFVAELKELAPVIDRLVAHGFNTTEPGFAPVVGADGEVVELPLSGKTVVVTGAMTGPLEGLARDAMNDLIARCGGKPGSSVSAKTDYLVAGDKGSSKYKKAQSLGVAILTPDAFAEMVKDFI